MYVIFGRLPSRLFFLLSATVLLWSLAGGQASAATGLGSPRVVNGDTTWDYPTAGILLSGGSANSASLSCSGTLIGCSTFLVASHCVCETIGAECQPGDAGEPNASQFMVFLQHAGFFSVSSIEVHPNYDFPTADVALVHLSSPVTGISPMRINTTATPPDGSTTTIVGFGRTGGFNEDYGIKRRGDAVTVGCGTPTLVCWDFEDPIGAPGEDSNTCNGDSGGPLFWNDGSEDVLAGVTLGGSSENCLPLDQSYDANVFHYRSWISNNAGADLGGEACGDFLPVGNAATAVSTFSGTLSAGSPDSHHAVTVPAGTSSLRVTMNASEEAGSDFDLYVRFGSQAGTSTYDCRHNGGNQVASCEIINPQAGTWWVLVHRYSGAAPYQATATVLSDGCGAQAEGSACDDQNICTDDDVCTAGLCGGTDVPNGTTCDDGATCSWGDSCQSGSCTAFDTPRVGCLAPVVPGKASLLWKDSPDDAADSLLWKWRAGAATSIGDFGSPDAGGASDLCVYDASAGTDALVAEIHIPANAGWLPTATGFSYRGDGSADGVTKILEKAAAVGKASIQVKGRGRGLPDVTLPFDKNPRVTVQFVTAEACFETVFTTATVNTAAQFKALSD